MMFKVGSVPPLEGVFDGTDVCVLQDGMTFANLNKIQLLIADLVWDSPFL